MSGDISRLFSQGLVDLNLSLDGDAQKKLLHFLVFLQKWNNHYNLTAITDLKKMVSHHLLDSLSIVPWISGEHILDVGSGAGFPGIPLAVYFPQKHWTLLDSHGKKTRFLVQAVAELGLQNVTVVHARAEQWRPSQLFDLIVVRAVGAISTVLTQAHHLLAPHGQWLFMKSEHQHEGLDQLKALAVAHPLKVPGVDAWRYVITVRAWEHHTSGGE